MEKQNYLQTINTSLEAMKRFVALLIFILLAATVFSQNVTLDKKNVPLETILNDIKNQTNVLFMVNRDDVNLNQLVSIEANNEKIGSVLEKLLRPTNLTYSINGKYITISSKTKTVAIGIQGIILDENGNSVIGAQIKVKGGTGGTTSDINGKFSLNVSIGTVLEVSYLGYVKYEIVVKNKDFLNIHLKPDNHELTELVVTALGIKRKESSLTYSVQQVEGDELTRSKDPNMMNALIGKTSGVEINRTSSGLGGSVKVEIRGSRSISGNNQPLYVIDGVPMINSTSEQAFSVLGGISNGANRDAGDGISNLNPDDIASMSILKGASAAALYGSQAANGVILITTKKGKAGVQNIQFSSNLTWDQPISLPQFQNHYGFSTDGISSWGDRNNSLKNYNNLNNFFSTGVTAINSLSITSGNEKAQVYISYANTTAKGIIDNNKLNKHNINVRGTTSLFKNLINVDANVNILSQSIKDRASTGGLYMNPLAGLYTFPRGMDITPYRTEFEKFNPDRNFNTQTWYTAITEFVQNPYWLKYRTPSDDNRFRVVTGLTASLKPTDWLTIQARGNYDVINDRYEQRFYASTHTAIASSNGRYVKMTSSESLLYGDIMALLKKNWGDWSANGAIGASINDSRNNELRLDSKTAMLYFPNVFTVTNIDMNPGAYVEELNDAEKQVQSLFGTAQLGYKESIYLDMTARNDWSSALAYTKSKNSGYFYPSVGLSWIMNKMLKLPKWINFGKVRGSLTKVGNDIPIFISNSVAHIGPGGQPIPSSVAPFSDLKPEFSKSIEFGTEWRFFGNRLNFDFTYYKTNTTNQLFTLPSTAGAEYSNYYVNAGNIENKGLEVTLGFIPIDNISYRWKSQVNYSSNRSKVIELHDQLPSFVYPGATTSLSYGMRLEKGGSIGDIYGKAFSRDKNGNIELDNKGLPIAVGDGNTVKIGNTMPKFLLGWGNTFTFKNFSLYALVDGRFGGNVVSLSQAILDEYGVSKNTGDARDAGYVMLDGKKITDIENFYKTVGTRSGITEYYMYDATNVRLRELSFGYNFPKTLLANTFIKQVTISLVGRDLFFLYKKAPYDPNNTLSIDNDNQGVDMFGMPTTRNIGFNLRLTF